MGRRKARRQTHQSIGRESKHTGERGEACESGDDANGDPIIGASEPCLIGEQKEGESK
jgi:hypothetical protein